MQNGTSPESQQYEMDDQAIHARCLSCSRKRNCSLLEIANAFKTVALEWDYTHNHSRTLPVATIAHASDAD